MAKMMDPTDSFDVAPNRIESISPSCLRTYAPAKINLHLLVHPVAEDGYHPLDSLVAKITFCDVIDLQLRSDGEITFSCAGAACGPDEGNLALLAAKLLAPMRRGSDLGVAVSLAKSIPPGAGLGGGSSDAAAVLVALNQLWQLGLPHSDLRELAAELGSDVPLFVDGPAARITGRGEIVHPIEVHPFTVALLLPEFACKTPEVYREFDKAPPPPAEVIDPEVIASRPPSQWRGLLANQLAPAARRVCPELAELWDRLSAAVPLPVHLTGSGSVLFVLCDDDEELRSVMSAVPPQLRTLCRPAGTNPW